MVVVTNSEMSFEKRSLGHLLKKLFHKEKRKENTTIESSRTQEKDSETSNFSTPAQILLKGFEKLKLEDKNDDNDDLKNFSYKIVKDDQRHVSISSKDSGISDKEDVDDDKKSDYDDEDKESKTKKKTHKVFVSRAPIRNGFKGPVFNPYDQPSLTHINNNTLSGGHVIVCPTTQLQEPYDYNAYENTVLGEEKTQNIHSNNVCEELMYIAENLVEDQKFDERDIANIQLELEHLEGAVSFSENLPEWDATYQFPGSQNDKDVIEEFNQQMQMGTSNDIYWDEDILGGLLTPPRSNENVFPITTDSMNIHMYSPEQAVTPGMSNSPASDYMLSPNLTKDSECYQEIPSYDDLPCSVVENQANKWDQKVNAKGSGASLTMKNFKHIMNDLSAVFAQNECCKTERVASRQVFKSYFSKLSADEQKSLSVRVACMDLEAAYGVLKNILLSLQTGSQQENVEYASFNMICERILAQKPQMFLDEEGHYLLCAAALRCPSRPIFTRLIVECINTAAKDQVKNPLFTQTDERGDTLVTNCVRRGSECVKVLAEILRSPVTLFDVHHKNRTGESAIHVCCSQSKCINSLHVLTQHGGADVMQEDVTVGDTALHHAVNSPNCDLNFILTIFKRVDKKKWKELAHKHNRSKLTPLEYARSAAKSTTRKHYPIEVVHFLQKCRN